MKRVLSAAASIPSDLSPGKAAVPSRTAAEAGRSGVGIRCGGLHDRASPDGNRHPVCSGAMRVETTEGNCEVPYTPPGGAGPGLVIRHGLPGRPPPFGQSP